MGKRKFRRVLVLGGNHDQMPYIKELKHRGFWIALTDLNENAPGRIYADAFKRVGYEDVAGLLAFADDLALSSEDSIFTAAAQFAHIGAASVAAKCEITYPPVDIVETCLDKTLFYPAFAKHDIPIPETLVFESANDLKNYSENMEPLSLYYLKSDFSKNPNYIYRFKGRDFNPSDYFWGRDRHLRNAYVLQKEFLGRHLRLNLMPSHAVFYDFFTNEQLSISESNHILSDHDILKKLDHFLKQVELGSWLIKFDIIVNANGWVALDIGLDPPSRMISDYKKKDRDFTKKYISLYLDKISLF